MADTVIEYAKAVQLALSDLDAEFSFVPEFTLAETQTKRCEVVPIGVETKIVSRTMVEKVFRIDVAILHKIKLENEINALIPIVEDTADRMLSKQFCSGVCIKTEISPLYDVSMILQKNLFVGVISASIKVVQ